MVRGRKNIKNARSMSCSLPAHIVEKLEHNPLKNEIIETSLMHDYESWWDEEPEKLFGAHKDRIREEIKNIFITEWDVGYKKIKVKIDAIRKKFQGAVLDTKDKSKIVKEIRDCWDEIDTSLMEMERSIRDGIREFMEMKFNEYEEQFSFKVEDVSMAERRRYAKVCVNRECPHFREDYGECKWQQCENVENFKTNE